MSSDQTAPKESSTKKTSLADFNESWADDLAPAYAAVWDKLQAQGVSAVWEDDAAPRFVVRRQDKVLASHPRKGRPVGVVVAAALFEAGHKLEAEEPGLKILPPMASA